MDKEREWKLKAIEALISIQYYLESPSERNILKAKMTAEDFLEEYQKTLPTSEDVKGILNY